MIDAIVTGFLLGLFAGAMPGPYTTVVATTALQNGFRSALPLVLVPLVTETPAMLLSVFVLQRVDEGILGAIGIAGGIVIAGIGAYFFFRNRVGTGDADALLEKVETEGGGGSRRAFWALAAGGLLSPAPWLFWFVAAGPLLVRAWSRSWFQGVVYLVILLAMFMATATGLAWAAARGRKVLSPDVRRKVLRGVGVVLVVAGGVLVWQAAEGNFQSMIDRQQELRERVESRERLESRRPSHSSGDLDVLVQRLPQP